MVLFLTVPPEKQRELLLFFKLKLNLTWSKVAKLLGVNRSMVYFYLNGKSKLPFAHLETLCKASGILLEEFEELPKRDYAYFCLSPFSQPNTESKEFAEFIGILLGDGCVYSNNQSICITGDKLLDRAYFMQHISKLVASLFLVNFHIYFCKNSRGIRCIINNKLLVSFLCPSFFVTGYKAKARAKIPSSFFLNDELLKSCLRGLFDTDGSVCPHPNSKVMLVITIKNQSLMESALEAFNQIGFPVKQSHGDIYLYGKCKVNNFFEIVGSSNLKHLTKWGIFLKTGVMPKTKDFEKIIRLKKLTYKESLEKAEDWSSNHSSTSFHHC